ncbi:hypothetical protein OCK74_19025 [Chitinophagaceae bacterium LB-8]|uniref:Uncharacterized protein n=1 Tax=Paraflavisolibacter caeni TaxID=2982496 RepID=A0A9X2XYX9_9BACT|nr:hypothetical protein [Paraflavisolibacter caeni]MCU7551222.1 hypothetical protein [Paraflavisolibacter caeni]
MEKVIQSVQSWKDGNEIIAEYKYALEEMPRPENATLEEIYLVADKVIVGILERNYSENVGDDLVLGNVARIITELYKEIKKQETAEQLKDSFYTVMDYDIQDDFEYFEKAEEVYKSVLLDNDKNIGGRVALADTNWELQKLSNDNSQLFFRKPVALNFEEVDEANNLYQLAIDGKISITNITVKTWPGLQK